MYTHNKLLILNIASWQKFEQQSEQSTQNKLMDWASQPYQPWAHISNMYIITICTALFPHDMLCTYVHAHVLLSCIVVCNNVSKFVKGFVPWLSSESKSRKCFALVCSYNNNEFGVWKICNFTLLEKTREKVCLLLVPTSCSCSSVVTWMVRVCVRDDDGWLVCRVVWESPALHGKKWLWFLCWCSLQPYLHSRDGWCE